MVNVPIPHDAWIFVGDGRKAFFFRNEGDVAHVKLKTVEAFMSPEPQKARELGADRPGRTRQRIDSRRSSMEEVDWHEIAEERFADTVSGVVQRMCADGTVKKLILIAPPRTLANLRKALPETLHPLIVAEVDKELTNHPVQEIERLLNS